VWRACKETVLLGWPLAVSFGLYCWLHWSAVPVVNPAEVGAVAHALLLGLLLGYLWTAALRDQDRERHREDRREWEVREWNARKEGFCCARDKYAAN